MSANEGVMQILEATNQAAPKMTEAIANYGNGRMGDGILSFMDWSWHEGKVEGRIEGSVVTGVVVGLIGLGSILYMRHKLKEEAKHGREVMLDLLDEMSENYTRKSNTPASATEEGSEEVTDEAFVECPPNLVTIQQ